jgi:hypothetical protein
MDNNGAFHMKYNFEINMTGSNAKSMQEFAPTVSSARRILFENGQKFYR